MEAGRDLRISREHARRGKT